MVGFTIFFLPNVHSLVPCVFPCSSVPTRMEQKGLILSLFANNLFIPSVSRRLIHSRLLEHLIICCCLTLCEPMDTRLPCPLSQSLLRFMSIELVMLSSHLILCYTFFFCLPSFPASWAFSMSLLFASDGPNIGALTSASVLPMNI